MLCRWTVDERGGERGAPGGPRGERQVASDTRGASGGAGAGEGGARADQGGEGRESQLQAQSRRVKDFKDFNKRTKVLAFTTVCAGGCASVGHHARSELVDRLQNLGGVRGGLDVGHGPVALEPVPLDDARRVDEEGLAVGELAEDGNLEIRPVRL